MKSAKLQNAQERVVRLEDATKLTDALAAAGIEAYLLNHLQRPAEFWAAAAAKAGVNPPSDEIQNLVMTMLRLRQVGRRPDPRGRFRSAS